MSSALHDVAPAMLGLLAVAAIVAALTVWWNGIGYGSCERCGRSWKRTNYHATYYGEQGEGGMIPLCERCWHECTPSERLPYYRRLFAKWQGRPASEWEKIERAVLDGR